MAQLIVGLTPTLAAALARGDRTRDTTRLHHLTHQARIDLRPQSERALGDVDHDDDEAPETVWFYADTGPDDRSQQQTHDLGVALRQISGVTAAFVKPEDGPP